MEHGTEHRLDHGLEAETDAVDVPTDVPPDVEDARSGQVAQALDAAEAELDDVDERLAALESTRS